jgi:hypothetical protein
MDSVLFRVPYQLSLEVCADALPISKIYNTYRIVLR